MKKFMNEFKEFISRGNVMDMAVGIIIGGAFTSIVSPLVEDIINPLLGLFGGMNFDQYALMIGDVSIGYGKFLTAVINFIIMAFVIFLIVKLVNKIMSIGKKPEEKEEPKEPDTKICPFCQSEISIKAVKCPHCTSNIPKETEK